MDCSQIPFDLADYGQSSPRTSRQVNSIESAIEAITVADALLITAGAGMGVDSGLPDFRGAEGFWSAYPPLARLGISFEEMANPGWLEKQADLAWGFTATDSISIVKPFLIADSSYFWKRPGG